MIFDNYFEKLNNIDTNDLSKSKMHKIYGQESRKFNPRNSNVSFVFSNSKKLDLIELDQLLQSVGWSRRPIRRVKKALEFSVLVIGVWRHDNEFPRLVGFARCTGDGVLEATVWDVAINPVYQGTGLGKELMLYLLNCLRKTGISKVTLFADPGVVSFYKKQGWNLEPKGSKCAFWYAT